MNKRIDFTKLEGLATYQDTLDFLQQSYRGSIAAIARAFGSKVIVTGVSDNGTHYSDGWVVFEGELMPFAGGLKTDRVIVEEITDTEVFGDGSTQTVYFTKRAKLGVTGGYAFAEFIRVDSIASISEGLKNLLTAHNNLVALFNNHTHTWSQITGKPETFPPSPHTHSWNDITSKPVILNPLYRGSIYLGDFPNGPDEGRTITFTNVGTANYIVVGSLVSLGGNFNNDNDVVWMVRNKTSSSFVLLAREVDDGVQQLGFDFALIPL